MQIDKDILEVLFKKAENSERLRVNCDMRTSAEDQSQRMLNILRPGTNVPIHRHRDTSETVVCLCGRMDEVFYELETTYENRKDSYSSVVDTGDVCPRHCMKEVTRYHLCPAEGVYGCQVPKGVWHTVEVIEPCVLFEAKDGAFTPAANEDIWNVSVVESTPCK